MRRGVASSATALAPFSQNSACERSPGSGQAQPGQSKPSVWLTLSSVRAPRRTPICPSAYRSPHVTPGTPAATVFGGVIAASSSLGVRLGIAGQARSLLSNAAAHPSGQLRRSPCPPPSKAGKGIPSVVRPCERRTVARNSAHRLLSRLLRACPARCVRWRLAAMAPMSVAARRSAAAIAARNVRAVPLMSAAPSVLAPAAATPRMGGLCHAEISMSCCGAPSMRTNRTGWGSRRAPARGCPPARAAGTQRRRSRERRCSHRTRGLRPATPEPGRRDRRPEQWAWRHWSRGHHR